ncbi:MAG: hypothetical protein H6592_09925 [Flavobacteriales bacterium]|nr:hypothetical protein [Flavobacteriales bacterium]
MHLRTYLLTASFAMSFTVAFAQFNQQGMVHVSLGAAIGAHGTELEQRYQFLGLSRTETSTDGAATVTFPLQVGYALSDRFALGLVLEPGRYVPDTANTSQQNGIFNLAIEPRFFLLNAERVAWHASVHIGGAGLRITDKEPEVDARYAGGAFGLGTGLLLGLGGHVGLGFDLRFLTTRMELTSMELNGTSVTDFFDATLRTGGVIAQLSLAFRFGGG